MERSGGILLPVSSLPSDCGIGTLGEEARRFVRFLEEAGQSYWQILPIGPTGYGDSPYQSFSSFAGNPNFVDFDDLRKDGLLRKEEYEGIFWGDDPERVSYEEVKKGRDHVLRIAAARLMEHPPADYESFLSENDWWLPDYALFMAEKWDHGGGSFRDWEPALRRHDAETVRKEKQRLAGEIRYYESVQYLFRRQWDRLRTYAHGHGIELIGDVPIYVSPDSSDLWSHPELFQLDADGEMTAVAGCPPDSFSEDGQLWGNPLYDWEAMKKNGYSWWIRRIAYQFTIVDVLRIDHFRGFESYFAIPAGGRGPKDGSWKKGPGIGFFRTVEKSLGRLRLIAEDLGYLTPDVVEMVKESGYPGMKVLLFAFDKRDTGFGYKPHCYSPNCVVYTGTHDNETVAGWMKSAPAEFTAEAKEYLGLSEAEGCHWGFIRAAYTSVANLAVIPFQDFLGLDDGARINVPSTTSGNWVWRMRNDDMNRELAAKIKHWMVLTDRVRKES